MTKPLSRRRFDALTCAALALMLTLSFALFYQLVQIPSSDLSIHATWAAEGDFAHPDSFLHHGAHPLWHVLVALVMLPGVPLNVAAALVTALCKVAELWLMRRLLASMLGEQAHPALLTALMLICGTVSCLCVPLYNPTVYLGVGTPNTWHSPTQLIAMCFMLVCVPLTARCYDAFERRLPAEGELAPLPWREPILLGVLLLLSLTAKPTFMQAFLPAACLFFLYQWIRHPRGSRYFIQMMLCVLPSVAFMIVQYMYYFGIIVPSQGSMVLEISRHKAWDVLARTLLIQAFPLYVLAVCRRQVKRDSFFWLALLMDAVGVIEFLLLGEDGRRAADGNFGWGMMGGALMLWLVMLGQFFRAWLYERDKLPRPAWAGGFALLGWHMASGVYYIGYLFVSGSAL